MNKSAAIESLSAGLFVAAVRPVCELKCFLYLNILASARPVQPTYNKKKSSKMKITKSNQVFTALFASHMSYLYSAVFVLMEKKPLNLHI